MKTHTSKKSLIWLVCLTLCLVLAAIGLSESTGGINETTEPQWGENAVVIKPSETYYHGETGSVVGPSEICDPGKGGKWITDDPAPSSIDKGTEKPENSSTPRQTTEKVTDRSTASQEIAQSQETITVGGIFYTAKNGIITVFRVTKEALNDGALVIPKEIPGVKGTVSYIYADAFKDVIKDMTSLTLPKSVTFIWADAFTGCSALKTIRFGGTKSQWNSLTLWLKLPEDCAFEFGVEE